MPEPDRSLISTKSIPPDERLIFALDVDSADEARALVETLGDHVTFYKIGLQLFMAGGYFRLLDWLNQHGKKVMVDLKFFDVPETVAAAVRQLKRRPGAAFATVHGNDAILRAACREKGDTKILAVTVLTSLDQADLDELGFEVDPKTLVLSRAKRALDVGCDGVVSSGLEATDLKTSLGERVIIVCPGIRPVQNVDDQKRTVDVEDAFLNGADYIVVGRPIRNTHDPAAAARDIQQRIKAVFGG
ncbi:MAG: orotidine-5'-phosphate decarboxylase [Alphaproteobacteria bacterium]|nr:orotidine-5'-phosphate decarboxylase [Alphaproteobacteria bacterium]